MGKKARLSDLEKGDTARVTSLIGGREFQTMVRSRGLREGKVIRVESKQPLSGPIIVRIRNERLAIGRGMAEKVLVDKL